MYYPSLWIILDVNFWALHFCFFLDTPRWTASCLVDVKNFPAGWSDFLGILLGHVAFFGVFLTQDWWLLKIISYPRQWLGDVQMESCNTLIYPDMHLTYRIYSCWDILSCLAWLEGKYPSWRGKPYFLWNFPWINEWISIFMIFSIYINST